MLYALCVLKIIKDRQNIKTYHCLKKLGITTISAEVPNTI